LGGFDGSQRNEWHIGVRLGFVQLFGNWAVGRLTDKCPYHLLTISTGLDGYLHGHAEADIVRVWINDSPEPAGAFLSAIDVQGSLEYFRST